MHELHVARQVLWTRLTKHDSHHCSHDSLISFTVSGVDNYKETKLDMNLCLLEYIKTENLSGLCSDILVPTERHTVGSKSRPGAPGQIELL